MDIKRPDLYDLETRLHAVQIARLIQDAQKSLDVVKDHILSNPAGIAVRTLTPLIRSIVETAAYIEHMTEPAPWENKKNEAKEYPETGHNTSTVTD